SHIELGGFFGLLLLPVSHHGGGHGEHFFRRDARDVRAGRQDAVGAQIRVVADFAGAGGGFVFDGSAEQIVQSECHVLWTPLRSGASCEPTIAVRGGQGTWTRTSAASCWPSD